MPDIKQSKWEEKFGQKFFDLFPIEKKEIKQFISDLLKERELEKEVEKGNAFQNGIKIGRSFNKTELAERDKQWLSCLPEEIDNDDTFDFQAGAFNNCRDEFLHNAKKLKLID